MEPEYKAVIDQRRAYLTGQVEWNKRFNNKLRQANILPKQDIDTLELDVNHGNRIYKLLARLVQLPEPGLYQRFCDVLRRSGQTQAANILLQDRDNIVWNFDEGAQIQSVDDFANVVTDILLHRLQREEDGYIRAVLTDEVRQRFTRMTRFLQDTVKQHTTYRLQSVAQAGAHPGSLMQDDGESTDFQHRPYLIFDDALDKMRQQDMAAGQAITGATSRYQQELARLEERLEERQQHLTQAGHKIKALEKTLEEKKNQSFLYLQKLIMEQDDTICQLRNQIKATDDLVKFSKGDMVRLLSSIRNTCPRAAMLPMPHHAEANHLNDVTTAEVTSEEALQRHLKALIDLCEQQKLRVVQGNNKIAEMDKERNVIKTLLNARGLTSLPATLSKQLRAFREQKLEMNETVRVLRQRLEVLRRERDEVREELEEAGRRLEMESLYGVEDGEQVMKGRRTRRKSVRSKKNRRASKSGKEDRTERVDSNTTGLLSQDELRGGNEGDEKNSDRKTLITQYVNMQNK